MTVTKICEHCGTLFSQECEDISLPPGQRGRSNSCYEREISNLRGDLQRERRMRNRSEVSLRALESTVFTDTSGHLAVAGGDPIKVPDVVLLGELHSGYKRARAQIAEAISILETGTNYEKAHVVQILKVGL